MPFRWLPEYCPPTLPRMSSKTANQDQRKNRYVRFSRIEGVHDGRAKAEKRYVRGFERGGVMRYWIGFDIGKRFHWLCVLDQEGDVVFSKRIARVLAEKIGLPKELWQIQSRIGGLHEQRGEAG